MRRGLEVLAVNLVKGVGRVVAAGRRHVLDAEGTIARQGLSDLLKYALIVVATAPILCVYPFLQRFFVKGVMIGSVKG